MICKNATVALLDANPFIFEHINGIFVRFCPSGPLFSGISSTKSRFLCSFTKLDVGVGGLPRRKRHRRTCGAVAPAQPILPLTLPSLHLHSRCTCAAVVSAQPLCHLPMCQLPSPVAAYRRCRRCCRCYRHCTCGAVAPAQPLCQLPLPVAAAYHRRTCRCRRVRVRVSFRLGRRS